MTRRKYADIDFRYSPEIIQTCIGLVDDPYKTVVREDGSLNYHFEEEIFDINAFNIPDEQDMSRYSEVIDDNLGFKHRLKPVFTHRDTFVERKQSYSEASLPFVFTEEVYDHTTFKWRTFAYRNASGFRADLIIWELTASDDFGRAPSKVALKLDGPKDGLPAIMESKGTTAYWTQDGFNIRGITHYDFLNAGETRKGVFAVVLDGEASPEDLTVEWAEKAEEDMRAYWKSVRLFEHRFTIPDEDLMEMLRSCARNILQAREVKDGIPEFQVGPTVYRGLWVIDGHFLLEAAHMMGQRDEAYLGVDAVLRRAEEDGSIQIIPDHYKETGIALATFVRQCELMNDDERLRELWPVMCKALDYILDMRQQALEIENYKGIFPPAFLDGGIAGPFPEYTTPLWIVIGLKRAYEEGERLELERFEQFKAAYTDIYKAIQRAFERDMQTTEEGVPFVKMNMVEREYDRPQSATWALAHAIYPGEIFPDDDAEVTNFLALLDSIDNTQGIPEETGWVHDQAVWGYSSMFYAQTWLYAGYPEKALDYLYSFANHAAPSRVWREEQSLTSSPAAEYCGDMPHNWGSAEFIRLVRHLLVFEKGSTLELLPGVPDEWLPSEGETLAVERTPTKYGEVTVQLDFIGNDYYELTYQRAPGNKEPQDVILHWKGKVERSASGLEQAGKNMWRIPAGTGTVTLNLRK
ncbi:hypothetical protein [Salipaludibacillus aurantiacus]|uniref:Alpha-L-rhamnosidase six-hairpin glycosidase domain-containing protein n=1 Tax=Salipaludibacillus aurantiacus TaxID=1601833 RepID=A0A1H9URE1_9BACI|nr:hypothetical protein [Salipaludibacillus aurantiacus]SES11627.1 hypothetical protein SAMN05518684_108103 [Salipaludibacillus aurantiacus]